MPAPQTGSVGITGQCQFRRVSASVFATSPEETTIWIAIDLRNKYRQIRAVR
jgi:hypothetical protein